MKIVLSGERPISWNKLYSGQHWRLRYDEAERVHELVRGKIKGWTVLPAKVNILVTAYFRSRPLDPDNICTKLYIDALKGIVITDDTSEYVDSVTSRSRKSLLHPRVEIEVEYANKGEDE